MTHAVTIQNITDDDLDEIIQLGLDTPELHAQDETPVYYTRNELETFIQSPHDIYLVAKIDGEIAGYRLATYHPFLKEAYLLDLVVKPKFRRMGIAKKLYEKTFEILNKKDCEWVWTLVKDSNIGMQTVIEKQGFRKGSKFYFYFKVKPF